MQKKSWTIKDFKNLQQLGKGKFGIVYKATQIISNQLVALKLIPKKKINFPNLKMQLKRQIQIHSKLKHKHICEMYGYFEDQHNVYIVLEYCAGGDLFHQFRKKQKILTQNEIKIYFKQIALAIAYLHNRSIIHRDIKLQNILIDSQNNLKLTDFGWCVHSPNQPRLTYCGTVQYLSPEIIKKQKYNELIDIHCLGVILYQLAYQQTPFFMQSDNDTIQNIKNGIIRFNDNIRKTSKELKQLIMLMLEKDPKKRINCVSVLKNRFLMN